MRVLFFSRDYTTHDRRFLAAIAAAGIDCGFLRLQADGIPYENRPLPSGVRSVAWTGNLPRAGDFSGLRECVPEFRNILEGERPDIVHAGPVQSCAYIAAHSQFSPLLVMSWGSDVLVDAGRDASWREATRFTLHSATAFVCDSNAVREAARPMLRCAEDRIVEFPWGVDLGLFSPGAGDLSLRSRLGWDDAVVVISTRNWETIYGIDVLLEAFATAHKSQPRLRLLMLGTGSQAAMVEDFISRRGLQNVVFRPGVVPQAEMPDYFRASDIYLACTHSDGTSISLLEAMAAGLPVVVTDAFGNREWVHRGENGWLTADGDSNLFASALVEAVGEPGTRTRYGAANRQIAEQRANWEQNVGKLIALYRRLVPAARGRSR